MFAFINDSLQYVANALTWFDLVITVLLFGGAFFLVLKVVKRKFPIIVIASILFLNLLGWFFSMDLLFHSSLAVLVIFSVVTLVINQADVRMLVANSLAGKFSFSHHQNPEKVFDRSALYQKIALTVESLSKNRVGAIITFERNTKLDDFVKSGTILNAPVTPELLTTIFYPGTRLHDGAVVIRRDYILAASVYYTPTTKPLTGKFGSRHRAAIGISEVTDSVTIVVSEETGRISLAVGGELIHVSSDNFIRTFEDYMLAEDESKEDK